MAKSRKPKTRPANRPQSIPQGKGDGVPTPIPKNEPPVKGRTQRVVERLVDSGINFLLDNFWLGVAALIISASVAIWLYIKSGQAVWLYPYLYFVLGFVSAFLMLMLTSLSLSYVKARRLKQAKNLKFVSQKKGFLDHMVNIGKARKQADELLLGITREIVNVGKTSLKGASGFVSAGANVNKRHKVASSTAAHLTKHAEKMEEYVIKLEQTTDLLNESSAGTVEWFLSQQGQSREELIRARQIYFEHIEQAQDAHNSIESYRNSQVEVATKNMSQDINTALNRLSSVTNDILEVLQKIIRNHANVITMIDQKLKDITPKT